MSSPAESIMPINDIEIIKPISSNHSYSVSEMLIIDENSRGCFDHIPPNQNPFRLTTYPRMCSYDDVNSAKGVEVFDTVVDIICYYQGIDSNQNEVNVPISGSGFLVAPPQKEVDYWEYYFFTCLHHILPLQYIKEKDEQVMVYFQTMKGVLGKSHRYELSGTRSVSCSIVAKSDLDEDEDEDEKKHPHKDWVLMKMQAPIDVIEEGRFPTTYLIPSPSKIKQHDDNSDYNMSILAFSGIPREQDVVSLAQHVNYHTNLNSLKGMFEIDCKNISFGKFANTTDEYCKHYNANSFPGSSGGAIIPCCEMFSKWSTFKESVCLDRSATGIHVGSEQHYNRCCPVKYWFNAFYLHVFTPMRDNFTQQEIEWIENEKFFLQTEE